MQYTMMKILFALILVPFLTEGQRFAPRTNTGYNNYYVSNSGSSGNSGASPSLSIPVSKLITLTFGTNDHIYFNKGETFNLGAMNFTVDGINILAYGSGAAPKIDGVTSLSASTWTSDGAGNYYTSMASAPGWIWINQVAGTQASTTFIPITSVVDASNIIVSAATINAFSSSIIGAHMFGKENAFRATQSCTVTGYNSGTGQITFTGSLGGIVANCSIILYNQTQFISGNNIWSYDASAQRLYVRLATSPFGTDIGYSSSTNDYAFNFGSTNNWILDGIELLHYNKYAILSNNATNNTTKSLNATIQNCTIHETRGDGMRIFGYANNFTCYNNTIYSCSLRGLEIGGINSGSITYNTIYAIGRTANLGVPFDLNQTGGTGISIGFDPNVGSQVRYSLFNGLTIDHNIIRDVGYQGIQLVGSNHIITKNHIYNFCLGFNDGGGIHAYYNNVWQGRTRNNLIQNNIIHDGIGDLSGVTGSASANRTVGLYEDSGGCDNTFDNNFSYNNADNSMFLNGWTVNITVTNNKFGANSSGARTVECNLTTSINTAFPFSTVAGYVFTGNTFFANLAANYCYANSLVSLNPFTTLDNNFYVNPYTANVVLRFSAVTQTFAQWKTFTGLDASSTQITNYIGSPAAGDYGYQSNPSDTPLSFNPGAGYKDASTNTNISGSVTIPAWGGLIYIKQ